MKPSAPKLLAVAAAGLLVCLVVGTQPSAVAQPRIVGGTAADQPYPFMVSLHSTSGKLFCAGSLVAPDWVVTAGHCVQGKNPNTLTARINSNDNTQGGEEASVAQLVVNPAFDPTAALPGGDIGLIRLAAPVAAAPITVGTVTAPGTATRVLGWGQTCPTPSCGKVSVLLQQLDTHLVAATGCTAAFDPKDELCTDNPGGKSGSCYGDSGGPEIVQVEGQWQVLGVTSRPGNGDATCATAPSIYTSVVAYAAWITSIIAPVTTPTPTPTPTASPTTSPSVSPTPTPTSSPSATSSSTPTSPAPTT
ncbi:MAG: trypsin-like serine protease [Amycolatopsis sp.]|uniref:S1 family peptidase n=1 Tax=Amycolatopsis sp. TaxID=37632 RepID=UPI00263425C2|nr:serine protease [Amycolatopsis sp.]MCU1684296.1 trypsin-like serine protease [Amycolatopsis sp.]